jgi:hypothetical protein
LIFVVTLSGCTTVRTVKYADEVVYPATNPEDIKVFSVPPPREYIEIGEISVEAPVYDAVKTIEELRGRVAKMGGEAVILRIPESKVIVIRFKD